MNFNEQDSINKDYLSTESSFYSRNQNHKTICKNDNHEKKNLKVTILNSNFKMNSSKDDIKENIKEKYLHHIKKVQSLSNISNTYSTQTYNNNANPFK